MNEVLVSAFIVFTSMQLSHAEDSRKPEATLEFRLAANVPVEKWTKHSVPGADDVIFVSPQSVLSGRDIRKVSFYKDDNGHPTIGFTLTDGGSAKMWTATSENIGKRLAILLDGKVVSAPKIQSGIRKKGVISGKFDDSDLLRFFTAIVLRDTSRTR